MTTAAPTSWYLPWASPAPEEFLTAAARQLGPVTVTGSWVCTYLNETNPLAPNLVAVLDTTTGWRCYGQRGWQAPEHYYRTYGYLRDVALANLRFGPQDPRPPATDPVELLSQLVAAPPIADNGEHRVHGIALILSVLERREPRDAVTERALLALRHPALAAAVATVERSRRTG